MMAKEKQKMVSLGRFREDPDNVSEATEEEIRRLAGKLKRVPLGLTAIRIAYVTDDPGGGCMVISGNKRLRVLKEAYGEDGEVPAEWFADVTAMSEAERHEFRLNANVSDGHFNLEKLLAQYDQGELQAAMGADALNALLEGLEEKEKPAERDQDAVPEVEGPRKSRRGAVYQVGRHRLMCGDSTSSEDVAHLMGGAKAHLLVTDPPYNVDYKGAAGKIKNDNMGDSEFRAFLRKAFSAANDSMKDGAAFYIWHADLEGYNFMGAVIDVGWKVRQCLVWVKNALVLGRKDYQCKHEPCLYGWKSGASHKWRAGRKQTTVCELIPEHIEQDGEVVRFHVAGRVFEIKAADLVEVVDSTVISMDKPARSADHPTMKPVELFAYQIRNSTDVDDCVLDIFGGSGTTVIACEQTQRRAFVMELDEKFCDVIRRRWAEFTNGEGCDWEALTPEVVE